MNKSFSEFNWGQTNQEYINLFSTENFINRIYEKHYKIQKDDVIVDVGSNYGSFSFSIQDSQPKHIYCIEPSNVIFDVLKENLSHMPCTFINKAIGCDDEEEKLIGDENYIYHQNESHFSTIKFKTFLKNYNIEKIDFLKFDCEGGEFHIFNEENLDFIKNNVRNIGGEYHITYHSNSVEKFINFRNNYLKNLKEFGKLYIYDRDDNNITEKIFDDDFVRSFEQNSWNTNPYKGQFMIYANFEKNNLNQKLINFPPVYYISLKDSIDRQKIFEEQFTSNGITNVNMVEAYDGRKVNYTQENDVVSGLHFLQLDSGGIATTISHLKAISDWYKNSNSEYAIFFEDDMTIDSINDWNFTWDEFLSTLPENWKAIQLSLIKDEITSDDMKLNRRSWWNWSAGSYLIKRNYAKELINFYCSNEQYFLRVKDEDTTIPCVEHCLFSMAKENAYTIPLFYENINFVSTFYEHFIESTHKNFQVDSSNYVKNWWKLKIITNKKDMGLKVVQIGSNKGNDELSEYIFNNYNNIEFGLFVEANAFHIEELKECYQNYKNINIENVAIKTPLQNQNSLIFYYHTNEHPHYSITTCDLKHLEKHMSWCPHLQGGEVKTFETPCITLDNLFEKYKIYELDILFLDVEGLDAEILLTFDWKKYSIKRVEFESLHLGSYSDSIKYMMIGMGYTQVNSLHEYNWAFEKKEFISLKDKLKNFPSVNYISIDESQDRRNELHKNFKKYGIEKITPHIYKKYNDNDHKIIEGPLVNHTGKGPVTSHLKAIKEWYENSNEPYTFFCEDDLSFDTVKYWNFTWDEFFNSLPKDWNIIQLCLIRENMFIFFNPDVKIRNRCWCDWSGCAYLITRKHAENLVKNYYPDDFIHLEYKGTDKELRKKEKDSFWFLLPQIENMIYSYFEGGHYTFPLFVENISFSSTWSGRNDNWLNVHSYNEIIDWWKTKGFNKTLDDLKL